MDGHGLKHRVCYREVAGDASHLFTTGHGVVIPYHSSPYLNLIYHASSYALQTEEWDQIIQSGFQSEKLADLTKLEDGVLTMRFVAQKTNEPLPFNLAFPQALTGIEMVSKATFPLLPSAPTGLTEKITSGLHFIAKLNQPIVISAAAGRRLQDILLGSSVAATFPAIQMQLFQMPNQQANLSMEVTLERVLLADRDAGVVYDLEMSNMQSCPSIRAKLQPDAYAPAFKIDQFAFETVDQLMAAVEVLRMQAYFNDLLQNLFEGAKVGKPERDIEAGITLGALLSGEHTKLYKLFIEVLSSRWPFIR